MLTQKAQTFIQHHLPVCATLQFSSSTTEMFFEDINYSESDTRSFENIWCYTNLFFPKSVGMFYSLCLVDYTSEYVNVCTCARMQIVCLSSHVVSRQVLIIASTAAVSLMSL